VSAEEVAGTLLSQAIVHSIDSEILGKSIATKAAIEKMRADSDLEGKLV
jgi:hypothetical protein